MALLQRAQSSLARRVQRVWAHALLGRFLRRKATQRLFTHDGGLYVEIFVPTERIPDEMSIEGEQVAVQEIGRADQIILPYKKGIRAYGAGFLGGVIVYAVVSMPEYCKALFISM
jgi:hypothetical protein